MNAKYNCPNTNIILNGENLKAFSLRSRMKKRYPLSPTLIQNYAANFNHSNKMRERNKGHPN
jgi:hypothetical protein